MPQRHIRQVPPNVRTFAPTNSPVPAQRGGKVAAAACNTCCDGGTRATGQAKERPAAAARRSERGQRSHSGHCNVVPHGAARRRECQPRMWYCSSLISPASSFTPSVYDVSGRPAASRRKGVRIMLFQGSTRERPVIAQAMCRWNTSARRAARRGMSLHVKAPMRIAARQRQAAKRQHQQCYRRECRIANRREVKWSAAA